MRRFFVDSGSISNNLATLSATESRHIISVLRMQSGDEVELFDSSGTVYTGFLDISSSKSVSVNITSRSQPPEENAPALFLYQSLLKGKKMDFLVQKCTELGVHSFLPVLTGFNENRGDNTRQTVRWKRIMLEACKQSKRTVPMHIQPALPLRDIDFTRFSTKLIFWEGESSFCLHDLSLTETNDICLVLGPEGGFHDDEISWAVSKGFQTVSLGPRILRAETASLAAIIILQFIRRVL